MGGYRGRKGLRRKIEKIKIAARGVNSNISRWKTPKWPTGRADGPCPRISATVDAGAITGDGAQCGRRSRTRVRPSAGIFNDSPSTPAKLCYRLGSRASVAGAYTLARQEFPQAGDDTRQYTGVPEMETDVGRAQSDSAAPSSHGTLRNRTTARADFKPPCYSSVG